MNGLTLVLSPAEPVPGLADRGLDALMRLAVDRIGACIEVIREAQITHICADSALEACADSLGSLEAAIKQAAMFAAIADLVPPLAAPGVRARHLQVVDGGAR